MAQKKHTRTGWDMRRRWTTPTAPPTNSRQYLLVRHGQAGAWPAPTCGGFRLGGGSPTGEHEHLQSGKRGKKKKSIQSNNTAGWNISANVRFVLRSKHDAYVPPSISDCWNMSTSHWRMFASVHASAKDWNPTSCALTDTSPHLQQRVMVAGRKLPGSLWLSRSTCSENKEPVYWLQRIQMEYWSPGQTTSSPLHPCDPNPGPGQLKAQDWKTRMNELSPALEKLLTQQTDWIRREQTDKQVKDVLEKLLVSFLNSDIFLCLPQSEKPDASLRKCRLSFAWREERLASSIGWEP